jgi:hypothetical protein
VKTIRKREGATTSFIIADLDPAYHDVVRELYYSPVEEGFAKRYPADIPHLDRIYQNFERYAEEMVLQMARVRSVPWEKALSAFLGITEEKRIAWWLAGSAALAARGIDITPRDLDLIVDEACAPKLGELLSDYIVDPVLPSTGWIANWFGRAFLHARLEWVGGVHASVDTPHVSDFGPTAASRLEVVNWHGKEIRVPPLDLQLQVSERRGLTGRAEKIRRMLKSASVPATSVAANRL